MGLEMINAGWLSILPPLVAVCLALLTKEVYSSLFAGLLTGTCIYCFSTGLGPVKAVEYAFRMMYVKIGENGFMIIFLALLWIVVALIGASGGTEAYGRWAEKRLNSKRSASLAAALLGFLIFIDDGFNCLTVGTVMRPVMDRHRISREKLAYIIDSTAAPVCIIAPVSSWAVAVASYLSDGNGFSVFLKTIPYNLYSLLTLFMVLFLCATGFDFGPMKKAEERINTEKEPDRLETESKQGRVFDLLIPLGVLVICSIAGMAYVGGFFSGVPFADAIGEDPTVGLTLGAFAGLLTAALLYLPRKVLSFHRFMELVVEGIKGIIPPMLILVLSWALSGVCRELIGTGPFVSEFIASADLSLSLLPVLVFLIAAFLSFSMGTSWGTFGILIPIVSMICSATAEGASILLPALGATLAGSVFGDHSSPISDTTILASAGADCDHLKHVSTQMVYAGLVAGVSTIGYLLAGFLRSPVVPLASGVVLLTGILLYLRMRGQRQ